MIRRGLMTCNHGNVGRSKRSVVDFGQVGGLGGGPPSQLIFPFDAGGEGGHQISPPNIYMPLVKLGISGTLL